MVLVGITRGILGQWFLVWGMKQRPLGSVNYSVKTSSSKKLGIFWFFVDNLFHLFHVPLLLRDDTSNKLYPEMTGEDFLNLSKALQLLKELKLVIFFLQVFFLSLFLGGTLWRGCRRRVRTAVQESLTTSKMVLSAALSDPDSFFTGFKKSFNSLVKAAFPQTKNKLELSSGYESKTKFCWKIIF